MDEDLRDSEIVRGRVENSIKYCHWSAPLRYFLRSKGVSNRFFRRNRIVNGERESHSKFDRATVHGRYARKNIGDLSRLYRFKVLQGSAPSAVHHK